MDLENAARANTRFAPTHSSRSLGPTPCPPARVHPLTLVAVVGHNSALARMPWSHSPGRTLCSPGSHWLRPSTQASGALLLKQAGVAQPETRDASPPGRTSASFRRAQLALPLPPRHSANQRTRVRSILRVNPACIPTQDRARALTRGAEALANTAIRVYYATPVNEDAPLPHRLPPCLPNAGTLLGLPPWRCCAGNRAL